MKRLIALCLILCAGLLSACNGPERPPVVIANEVPQSLLICAPEPEKPSFNTGDPAQDFKNAAAYAAKCKAAGAECRARLESVARLVNQRQSIPQE